MARLHLTLALEHYDRHLPLLDGTVEPEGIDLQVFYVSSGQRRHERMLDEQAWDVSELSLSSYIMAKARGTPLTAIPVFPRRLFSQSQMYINTGAGIRTPQDLIGKRVGLPRYQTTLAVLAKGDLRHEYGVPLEAVTWVTSVDEAVPFTPPGGISIQRAPNGRDIGDMLVEGELDALFTPQMPRPFAAGMAQVARLFPDPRAEEKAYYQRNGFYPIMHIVVIKSEIVAENPWVETSLMQAFERAKAMAFRFYDDPNWSHLAWTSLLLQEQREALGADPWPNGIAQNRRNLERFIQYQMEQGLLSHKLEVDDLFAEASRSS